MATVSDNLTFIAGHPSTSRVYQSQTFDLGTAGDEYTRINITVTDEYRQLNLETMTFEQNGTVATQIGYDDSDRGELQVLRGNQPLTAPLQSERMFFKGLSATQIATWCFDPNVLRYLPALLPGDVLRLHVPPMDDNAAPTADVAVTAGYIIVQR